MTINKTLIGLTGNIATGKSVIRRMLVNLGALGLDADEIAHRTLYPGGAAYQPVIDAFGPELLDPEGEISRTALGKIVFSDPSRLQQLESLVHPAVTQSIQKRIKDSKLNLIVIEAIKLFESPLIDLCSAVWVSDASPAVQLERLLHTRNMSEADARKRIAAQPSQAEKRNRANAVINTEGEFVQTWQQVQEALSDTIQSNPASAVPYINITPELKANPAGQLPAEDLAAFWVDNAGEGLTELFESLAFHAVLALTRNHKLETLLLIKVHNFTASLTQAISSAEGTPNLQDWITALEQYSRLHQCELLILPEAFTKPYQENGKIEALGFSRKRPEDLSFPGWREAALRQCSESGRPLWVKIIAQPFI